MLNEDSHNQEDTGGSNKPQLSLKTVFMMVLVLMMMFVRATFAMFVLMCHIFASLFVSGCKGTQKGLQLGCKVLNSW